MKSNRQIIKKVSMAKEPLETLQKGYNASFPSILTWARQAFDSSSKTFFLTNLVTETVITLLDTWKLALNENKNAEKISDMVLNWLKIGMTAFLIFGMTSLNIAFVGAFLVLNPFISFVKAIGFGVNMLMSKSLEEKEAHYKNLKKHALGAVMGGIATLAMAALILIPGAPIAATATLAVVSTITVAVPFIVGLVDNAKKYLPQIWNKWWYPSRNENENKPEIVKAHTLNETRRLSTNLYFSTKINKGLNKGLGYTSHYTPHSNQSINYKKTGYFKNIVINNSFSYGDLEEDIANHIHGLDDKLGAMSFIDGLAFQKEKYEEKEKSLKVLQNVLVQWNQLMTHLNSNDYTTLPIKYQIHLHGEDYITIPTDQNGKFDMPAYREKVFKLVKEYVLEKYPHTFQSFGRFERGDTEALFDKAFIWMHRNKTNEEIINETRSIEQRIDEYETHHQTIMGRVERLDLLGKSNTDSIQLLKRFLNAVKNDQSSFHLDDGRHLFLPSMTKSEDYDRFKKAFIENSNMKDSFAAVGERAKIFEDICGLLDSKQLAHTRNLQQRPSLYTDPGIHELHE